MTTESAEAMLGKLYECHHDEVLAYCTRRIGRTDADDATADVFVVAWRRIDEIDWDTAQAWLYGIARGVLANRWRAARRRARLVDRVSGLAPGRRDLPDDKVMRRAEDQEVVGAIRQLRVADREVLMLAAWEELTAPEIAAALDISVSAAEQRLHRAKKRLAKVLGPAPQTEESPRAAGNGGGR